MPLLPEAHVHYLKSLALNGVSPKVVYDLGSCTLHWYNSARTIWPGADFYLVDAMHEVEFLYQEGHLNYSIACLSDSDRKTVTWNQTTLDPGGNSYYQENPQLNPLSTHFRSDCVHVVRNCTTLDSLVSKNSWPWPDLVKMDIQGAELDVLKGMSVTLQHVEHLILELQATDYNQGAPERDEVVSWLDHRGFSCAGHLFCDNGFDGDYHFVRRML